MDTTIQLDLENPVAAAGAPAGVWIADGASNTVTRFDPATGNPLSVISLEAAPVDVEVVGHLIVVGLADGSIVMYDIESGKETLRRSVVSGNPSLRSAGDRIWVLDRELPALVAFDLAGNRRSVPSGRVVAFAAGSDGVYWISDDGMVRFGDGELGDRIPTRLPGDLSQMGAMVACANSLWVSVPDGLLMVSLWSLRPGNTLPAPEGPVPHLICDEGRRIIGGARGVFVLDPAADAEVQAVAVDLKSELRALVAAANRIWALESAEPIVHIL